MRLVQVNAVHAQALETVLDLDAEGIRAQAAIDLPALEIRKVAAPGIIPPEPALGRDDDLVPAAFDRPADDRSLRPNP